MYSVIHDDFKHNKAELEQLLLNFDRGGEILVEGKRNTIKTFFLDGLTINVKSFRIPNLINRIAYNYLRKSKARRSFEFARRLLQLEIHTPQPIAFFEEKKTLGLRRSFYISEQLEGGFTFRDLIHNEYFPQREKILRQFARFTFDLHEKGVWFLDHSPGNTIILPKEARHWNFYLVDINRMKFRPINRRMRIENFSRLSASTEMLTTMGREYATAAGWPEEETVTALLRADAKFRNRRKKKKILKRHLGLKQ